MNDQIITSIKTWIKKKGIIVLIWIYLTLTQCHGLMWFDSGELALVAQTWGIAHPPGQPLYIWLGALTTFLWGPPLFWLTQISVISLTLSIVALFRIWTNLGQPCLLRHQLTAFFCITLYPIWDQGTRIEVYALAGCLYLWSLVFELERAFIIHSQKTFGGKKENSLKSGICLGGCLCVNPVFGCALGLSFLMYGMYLASQTVNQTIKPDQNYKKIKKFIFFLVVWYRPLFFGLVIGGLPYLYLVFSIYTSSQAFIWGDFSSLQGVIDYLTGADYRGNQQNAWHLIGLHALEWVFWLFEQGVLIWMIFAGIGILRFSVVKPHLYLNLPILMIGLIFPFLYHQYSPEIPDFEGYMIIPFLLSLLGIWSLLELGATQSTRIICIVILAFSIIIGASPPYQRGRMNHVLPIELAQNWLNQLPPNSVLLIESDHLIFPLMYVQEVLKIRTDILVFNVGFQKSSWYWKWLRQKDPQLPVVEYTGSQRVKVLVYALANRPFFSESFSIARQLGLFACPAGWGFSLQCQYKLPLPSAQLLKEWAQQQAHQDPITQKVLARLGHSLSLSAWSMGQAKQALFLGYAALGKAPLQALSIPINRIKWWAAPAQLWSNSGALIGSPTHLSNLLIQLEQGMSLSNSKPH